MTEAVFSERIAGALTALDLIVLAGIVGAMFLIACYFGRREEDTADFFVGRRKVPAAVACLSFVATEVSAVTIMSVPATGYSENWQYLQFFVGSAAARICVAFLFIPVFYRYQCTSIYEFLRHRFGPETQYAGSLFFFITRLLASGVRLYAACSGVSWIMGWSLGQTLLGFTLVSMGFIVFGGIKAVVWAGAYQAIVFYGAGIALLVFLCGQIDGGWSEIWRVAGSAGRLSLFDFHLSWNDPTTFWAGSANAFFIGLAIFGADQELMQRLLTVKTRQASQRAIIATIFASLPLTCIYLAVGTLLYVYYHQHLQSPPPEQAKEVLSHFVVNTVPAGLKALVLAAVILASIDSPLASLSSSFVTDIYRPLLKKNADERHYLLVSRVGVIVAGVMLAVIAYSCQGVQNILWFAFKVVSVTGGATLGVFLLGLLTRRKGTWGNVTAMVVSTLGMGVLLILNEEQIINLAWSWLLVLGTIVTFAVGYVLGRK